MYTKVFRTIYDGTLADNWQALVTFQQLLILANDEGVVDMTVNAIHRTTGIPLDVLSAGIKALEQPDQASRSPDMEGRRIARLDEHREWGWFLVNFAKYRKMLTREDKKEADRARIAEKRAEQNTSKNNNVANGSEVSQPVAGVASCSELSLVSPNVANVAHTDTDTDTEEQKHPQQAARAKVRTADRFEEFWIEYPVKKGRADAEKKWKLWSLDAIADRIIADVKQRKLRDRQWLAGYAPHGSTYVNGRGWEDEIEDVKSSRPASNSAPDYLAGAV